MGLLTAKRAAGTRGRPLGCTRPSERLASLCACSDLARPAQAPQHGRAVSKRTDRVWARDHSRLRGIHRGLRSSSAQGLLRPSFLRQRHLHPKSDPHLGAGVLICMGGERTVFGECMHAFHRLSGSKRHRLPIGCSLKLLQRLGRCARGEAQLLLTSHVSRAGRSLSVRFAEMMTLFSIRSRCGEEG